MSVPGVWVGKPEGVDTGATQAVASDSVCSKAFAVTGSAILTCHADNPPAASWTECQALSGPVESPALREESVFATQMYDDGDLSLTSTFLVNEPVPSTQACTDDLPPGFSMPPRPVPKRVVTSAQRSSVDSGVVAVHVRAVDCRFRA